MNNYDGDYEVCIMNADGTGTKQLTKNSSFDGYPSWSPDGTKIAFASNRDGDVDIWVMNADDSEQTNITNDDPWNDDDPHWSPDGRWIAITTDRYNGLTAELITPDGKSQATIGSVAYAPWFDSWSPDGKSLLVDSNRGGDYDIYRYDISGTAPLQWDLMQGKIVSDDNAVEGPAIWSPDGKEIALSSNRDGDFEVYVMNAEGGPQRQVTHNAVDDVVLDWQSLHDLRAPSVKALPSRGTLGKAITLRFKASDNSGRASVGSPSSWASAQSLICTLRSRSGAQVTRTPRRGARTSSTATSGSAPRLTIRPATRVPGAARPSSRADSEAAVRGSNPTNAGPITGAHPGDSPTAAASQPTVAFQPRLSRNLRHSPEVRPLGLLLRADPCASLSACLRPKLIFTASGLRSPRSPESPRRRWKGTTLMTTSRPVYAPSEISH